MSRGTRGPAGRAGRGPSGRAGSGPGRGGNRGCPWDLVPAVLVLTAVLAVGMAACRPATPTPTQTPRPLLSGRQVAS